MSIEEAIKIYGADAVFASSATGECENHEPSKAMGFDLGSIERAEQIGHAVYGQMTAEEKAALHWEASLDL